MNLSRNNKNILTFNWSGSIIQLREAFLRPSENGADDNYRRIFPKR